MSGVNKTEAKLQDQKSRQVSHLFMSAKHQPHVLNEAVEKAMVPCLNFHSKIEKLSPKMNIQDISFEVGTSMSKFIVYQVRSTKLTIRFIFQ